MEDLDLVGIDLAKNVFQLHGCSSTGEVVFRKQLKRNKLLAFISGLPTCTIAMVQVAQGAIIGDASLRPSTTQFV
jgi:transposase